MTTSRPRFFPNKLEPVPLDEESLRTVLSDLQRAIASGIAQIEKYALHPASDSDRNDSLYTGQSGISLMYLRLNVQAPAIDLPPTLRADIARRLQDHLPNLHVHRPNPGHLSPLTSPVGPAALELLRQIIVEPSSSTVTWDTALSTLKNAVVVARQDDQLGGDEALYGRAGLLWTMLNLRKWVVEGQVDVTRREELEDVVGQEAIKEVVDRIVQAGRVGADEYKTDYGEDAPPLMWDWHGKYYLGAVHGVTGILTILLQCPQEMIEPYLPLIISSIASLLTLTTLYTGHLPSSLPTRKRTEPLVQICHGNPGLLLLLATFRATYPSEWRAEWDEMERTASDRLWEEGLVKKGLGVCHGVSGNAWPWLLLAEVDRKTKPHLSRSLAFLLHATQLPPITQDPPFPYRTPDHPYSLFEGLAGTICAWADACMIIQERLGGEQPRSKPVLGMPGLGGLGIKGVL